MKQIFVSDAETCMKLVDTFGHGGAMWVLQ